MNDQMFRDAVCLLLIGTVVVLSSLGHAIPPALQEWADTAFGFLFGIKSAGYMIPLPTKGNQTVDAPKTDAPKTEG